MSGEKSLTAGTLVSELFQLGYYKPTQGRVVRQATLWALAITVLFAAYRLFEQLKGTDWFPGARMILPLVILGVGLWVSFRLVNFWRFADFLIAVEAEMSKVSWPSKSELIRSAAVVIFVLFALSATLFGFDVFWGFLFEILGVVKK
ncbi:MAG: preprotein translocase subunit SecE [Planctomycetota bacterium]